MSALINQARQPEGGGEGADWPVVTDQWVATYCELTGRDPEGRQVTFTDGGVVAAFKDVAKREIEAMLCAAPKSAVRTLTTDNADGLSDDRAVAWPEKWGGPCTVGNMIANLSTLPLDMPIHTAYHITFDDDRKSICKVKRPTLSRERVDGTNIKTGDASVPYSAVIWAHPQEPDRSDQAPPAGKDLAGEALKAVEPPLRWENPVMALRRIRAKKATERKDRPRASLAALGEGE